jgi:subtilisin
VIYPAQWGSVVAVVATSITDIRAPLSSTGPANELAAPGVSIYSTVPGGGYMDRLVLIVTKSNSLAFKCT